MSLYTRHPMLVISAANIITSLPHTSDSLSIKNELLKHRRKLILPQFHFKKEFWNFAWDENNINMLEWIIDGLKTVSKQSARGMRNSLCWWKQNPFVICKTMQVTDYYDNHKTVISANHMILLMSIHLILAIADFYPLYWCVYEL